VNVAADGDRVRAVGSNGLVAAARRLDRWRLVPTPVEHDLRGVVWTGERWAVAGDVGTVLGKVQGGWSPAAGIPAVGLRGIAARPGLVAASGANGVVVTSADGLDWQVADSGTTEILWGGTGVGSELWLSGRESTIVRSADGATWSPVPTFPAPTDNTASPRPFLWQLATDGDRVVAVGDFGAILAGTAATGLTAVPSPTDEILRGAAFAGGRWVAVGSGGEVLLSRGADASTWEHGVPATTADLRGVAFTGRRFVAVGDQSTVISSRDGRNWRLEVTAMPCALLGLARADRRFVAVGGSGLVMRSRDGRAWERMPAPTTRDLYAAAHGPGTIVAVGSRGIVLTSGDEGATWTRRRSDTRLNLHTVFWTGDEYLAGGDIGRVLSSPDGRTWERVDFPGYHSVRGFATDGASVVAAGAGTIARRAPGQAAWELEQIGFARFQTAIAYGGGRFVIVGHNGEALASSDGGETWTAGASGVEVNLDAIAWTGERFIATGEGVAIASEDGLGWQPVELPTQRSVRAMVARGSRVVGVGDGRTRIVIPAEGP
jgi:photosystem II stability/assembly factor-like uncharacterized protein